MKGMSEHMCPPFRDQSHQGIRLRDPPFAGGTEAFVLKEVNDLTQELSEVSLERKNILIHPLLTRNRSFVQLTDLCAMGLGVFQRHVGVWESHSGGNSSSFALPEKLSSSWSTLVPPRLPAPAQLKPRAVWNRH